MAATPVTPIPGLNSAIVTGGTAVVAVDVGPNGGFITNPSNATDQGISAAESIYVDPVATAHIGGYGTTFEVPPGGTWQLIPGQTTQTTVNATSSSHRFSVVSY